MRIAIVPHHQPRLGTRSLSPENLHLTPSASLLKAFRRSVSSPLDLLIVLSHQSLEEDIALAKRHKDIDIIIGGHSQALLSPPKLVNGTVICQPGKDGENLGVLLVSPHRPRLRASSVSVAEPTGMATTNDCGSATLPFHGQNALVSYGAPNRPTQSSSRPRPGCRPYFVNRIGKPTWLLRGDCQSIGRSRQSSPYSLATANKPGFIDGSFSENRLNTGRECRPTRSYHQTFTKSQSPG